MAHTGHCHPLVWSCPTAILYTVPTNACGQFSPQAKASHTPLSVYNPTFQEIMHLQEHMKSQRKFLCSHASFPQVIATAGLWSGPAGHPLSTLAQWCLGGG